MSKELRDKIFFYGTPDNDYRDSGLWLYLEYVRTFDEHEKDPTKVYKPLPRGADGRIKAYILFSFYCMLRYPELAVPKSRQIMMSWLAAIFAAWYRRTGPNKAIYWQGLSEDEAAKMICVGRDDPLGARMTAIDLNLTEPKTGQKATWLVDRQIDNGKGLSYKKVVGENSSRAIAIAEGGDKIRGKVPSLYCADECAFQDGFKEGYFNVQPCLTGGGRGIYFSSANNRSFFSDLVGGGNFETAGSGDEWSENLCPLPGMKLLKNKESGLYALWVHHTADEDKRPGFNKNSDRWLQDAAGRYAVDGGVGGAKWRREMDIDFTAVSGNRVFGFLSPESKVFIPQVRKEIALNEMKIVAGMDYGIRDPLGVMVWGIDKAGQPHALWEYETDNTNYQEACAMLKESPYFHAINGNIVADGSMFKAIEGQYGITSVADYYASAGVHLVKADRKHRPSIDVLVADYFLKFYWADPDHPKAFIGSNCPKFSECVMNLKWDEHSSQKTQSKSGLKEEIQHAGNTLWDATGYIFYRILPKFRRTTPMTPKWTIKYIEEQLDSLSRRKRWKGGKIGA